MTPDAHPDDLLGAYVVDACSDDEARLVAAHAARCVACADEIARLSAVAQWVGAINPRVPPRELRSRVLTAAMAARAPCEQEVDQLLEPYVSQVAAFDRLLDGLSDIEWQRSTANYPTIRALVAHLSANDALVSAAVGAAPDTDTGQSPVHVRRGWHGQAARLVRTVAEDRRLLDRAVPLAGKTPIERPLREALTQRAFETWIHAEDLRMALALPAEVPAPEQITRIADFGLRLLPAAMDAAGRGRPHQVIRLRLTGSGGGERLSALSATSPTTGSTVVAEVSLSAVVFCRLLAGRTTTAFAGASVDGDVFAAQDFLTVAATMGCD